MRSPITSLILISTLAACGDPAMESDSDGSSASFGTSETSGVSATSTGGESDTEDDPSGTSTSDTSDTSDTSTTGTSATTSTTGTSDTEGTTDSEGTTDTGGEMPASICDATELPSRDGAEIIVSPSEPGMVEVDGVKKTLRQVISSAMEGDTVILEDGVYTLPQAQEGQYTGVYITTPNITVRSASGDPKAVTIDAAYRGLGGQSGAITIDAPGVVIADIGVQRSIFHLVHFWSKSHGSILHNLELVDGGQQFVKSSSGDGEIDGVQISCSNFQMTAEGRDNVWGYGSQGGNTACYTGGIDTHDSTNWTVRDNRFEGIYCDADGVQRPAHGMHPEMRGNMTYTGGLSEHAIHMWDSTEGSGHTLTRNLILNCARGIGLGFVKEVYGSTITNNMVFSSHPGGGGHDVGISVERANDTLVAHNTVYFSDAKSYGSGIEYRWSETSGLTMQGNLCNRKIRARDGAQAELIDNVAESAPAEWFVDAAGGDLHLAQCDGPGSTSLHPDVALDVDGDTREEPTPIGADHCAG